MTFAALLPLALCGTGPAREERALEFVHQPVNDCREHDGVIAVGLGPMARWFSIHPELSPDAEEMAAFARRAQAHGRPVYATIWIRESVDKASPEASALEHPWVLVRLAETPDPAQ